MESSNNTEEKTFQPPLCQECGLELKGFHDCNASKITDLMEKRERQYDLMFKVLDQLQENEDEIMRQARLLKAMDPKNPIVIPAMKRLIEREANHRATFADLMQQFKDV